MWINSLPIYILYYFFPFVSILCKQMGMELPNYEPFWILLLVVSPFIACKWSIKKRHFIFLSVVMIAILFKYVVPILYVSDDRIVYRALIMDGKWFIYLLWVVLWINLIGYPPVKVFYKAGIFFSKLFIIYSIFLFVKNGLDIRPGIIDEANYDGLMILIPFCFVKTVKGCLKDYIIVILATLCTGSRTGIVSLVFVLSIIVLDTRPKLIGLFVPLVIGLVISIFTFRGFKSIETIDRYVFFEQAAVYFQHTDINKILFGTFPGVSLNMPVLRSFGWYIREFEGKNDIIGIFPFYFHSTYIRLAMTWGLPTLFSILVYLVVVFFRVRYLPLKLLIAIVLLQSVALSTMTLTNVSAILFLSIFAAINARKQLCNY